MPRPTDVQAALSEFQSSRQGDVTRIEKNARRNEWMMNPSSSIFYWIRNKIFAHTPDSKLMEIAEGMTSGQE